MIVDGGLKDMICMQRKGNEMRKCAKIQSNNESSSEGSIFGEPQIKGLVSAINTVRKGSTGYGFQ